MADDSEDQPSSSKDVPSTAAAVLDTFNRLKKWREEQIQQFRNKQLYECQKFCDERQKNFERVLETATKSPEPEKVNNLFLENCNLSSISEKNDSEYYDTLQESSITGHLQRCFDDSSQSNLSVTGNKIIYDGQKAPVSIELQSSEPMDKNLVGHKDQQKEDTSECSSVKLKRPFLKKGSGLLRFMPKSATSRQPIRCRITQKSKDSPKRNLHVAQKTLQLKPAIRSSSTSSESVKHIRFDIPKDINENSNEFVTDSSTSTVPKLLASTEENGNDDKSSHSPLTSSSSPEYYFCKNNKLEAISNSGSGSLNLQARENKELEEFEMLENCAQNSSFNSDSSVVQRVLHGERAKPSVPKENVHSSLKNMNVGGISKGLGKNPSENSIFSANLGLSKCQEEIQARKQILHKMISDINPRIQSLQKEISNYKDGNLDDSDISERCSTPIEDLDVENKILSSASLPEHDCNRQSSQFHTVTAPENADQNLCNSDCRTCNFNGILKDSYSDQNSLEEQDSACEIPDLPHQSDQTSNERSKIQEKRLELEREIQIYQEHNAKLASICKERDEIMKTLQKERENFEKYKETEKKKVEAEIQEERRQIRRQKETFTRYQKLRRDNPTRKEREELNALRQEVEKLQEELKRQKIKYTSDSRRWKNQVDAAERERDNFKLENIRLEEQVQDLLSALRSRMKKKNYETNSTAQLDKLDEGLASVKGTFESKEVENHTQMKQSDPDNSIDLEKEVLKTTADKKTRQKVRFNLEDECNRDFSNVEASPESKTESLTDDVTSPQEIACKDVNQDKNVTTEKDDAAVNLSVISVSVESEFKEIDHGNKIERIYPSGEREIIFPSGTRKIIKADGLSIKFLFYNGDTKEIFPDKREIYSYVNGVTETHFPDGLEVTEFPNGQIQQQYPDGHKEVKFPDGTAHNIYSDGSEKIRAADGNVINLSVDGTKTIEYANGQREIQTATYRRREFPDGSVKIIYDSGRQETRYSDGRIRIKDKDGKVIVDTKYAGMAKG